MKSSTMGRSSTWATAITPSAICWSSGGRGRISARCGRFSFRQNRVMSSITADLDQKSCWEVFTNPQFTQKYFNADERQVFRRHILWTRLLGERRTLLPDGQTGDLLPYVRHEQETLVLKPNRGYGGQGVILGPAVSAEE